MNMLFICNTCSSTELEFKGVISYQNGKMRLERVFDSAACKTCGHIRDITPLSYVAKELTDQV